MKYELAFNNSRLGFSTFPSFLAACSFSFGVVFGLGGDAATLTNFVKL